MVVSSPDDHDNCSKHWMKGVRGAYKYVSATAAAAAAFRVFTTVILGVWNLALDTEPTLALLDILRLQRLSYLQIDGNANLDKE